MENALDWLAFLCISLVFVRIGTFNRQFPDEGRRYRPTILPTNDDQVQGAKAHIPPVRFRACVQAPIVTLIEAGRTFYRADDDHQEFLAKNPGNPYIVFNDPPVVALQSPALHCVDRPN
jgi:peptide methionine sulfoxide reductase MsrA